MDPLRAAMRWCIASGVLAAALHALEHTEIAIALFLAGVALAIVHWRTAKDVAGLLLRVEAGQLEVFSRASMSVPLARIRLAELDNVRLDTKEIRKVVPGAGPLPAVRFIDSSVAPEVDVARIVLVPAEGSGPVPLTDAYLAHMDAIEWLGKIRTFLRASGWVPEDEREQAEDEDDAPASDEAD